MTEDKAGVLKLFDDWLTEALELRRGVRMENVAGDQHKLVDTLVSVRVRIDRVEELLTSAIKIRNYLRGESTRHKLAVEVAYDKAITAQRKTKSTTASLGGEDFLSAKERNAMANLDTLELRIEERASAALTAEGEHVVELIRIAYRGLTDMRQDLMTMLRAAQFETTLDR